MGLEECVGAERRRTQEHLCRNPPFPRFVFVLCVSQDTLGRIVAYDLLSGSMLGVLALGDSSTASPEAARPGVVGSSGAAASAETIVQKPGVVWASGGGRLAAVIFDEKV